MSCKLQVSGYMSFMLGIYSWIPELQPAAGSFSPSMGEMPTGRGGGEIAYHWLLKW